jgi:hypothetical protein
MRWFEVRDAMTRSLLLLLVLVAPPAFATAPRIAALDFTVIGLDASMGSFYAEHLSVRLESRGLRVTTQRDIAAVLSVERQKQLLGCADDSSSCMAELAGALGVDALISGQVARVGKSFQLNLRILSARDAAALFTYSKLVKTEEALLEALNEAGDQAAVKLLPADGAAVAVAPTPEVQAAPASPVKPGPWILVGTGAAAAVAGGIFVGLAASTYSKLTGPIVPDWTPDKAAADAQAASTQQTIGIVCLAVGAAAVAGGLAWHFIAKDDVAVSIVPTGPGVLVEARW